MEPAVIGWREELKRYIRSIESISETALKAIKRDRIQNHLPFDGPFKESILGLTSARIANVYTNLLYEEILDDGQNVLNQNVNHQNDGNSCANSGQQLVSTRINPPLIEETPIILVAPNDQQVASTSILSTTFDPDDNQTVSMPSNQLSIPPVEVGINAIVQGIRTGFGRDSVVDEPLAVSNANKDTENVSTVASGSSHMAMKALATGVTTFCEPFGRAVNSTAQNPETVKRRCKAEQFKCHLCSKKYYQQKGHFLNHMRYKHPDVKSFGCPNCRRRFCKMTFLIRHSKSCH